MANWRTSRKSLSTFFFFQAEDGIRVWSVTGVQTCALPISFSAHVAARRAHAENACARQKMIQRFLLDGIDLQSGGRTIPKVIEFSVLVDADEAESRLARMNVAVPRTEIAVDTSVRFRLPPPCFVEFLRFLEDL